MYDLTVADDLEAARDLIEFDRGWCRYMATDSEGRVCLSESIRLTCGFLDDDGLWIVDRKRYSAAVAAFVAYHGIGPVTVNDVVYRTMDGALDALTAVAKAIRNGEL